MIITVMETRDGAVFRVKCRPSAPKTRVTGIHAGALKLDVAAPPERGKANDEVISFLARALGLSTASIRLTAGEAGREKSIRISGITQAVLAAKLAAIAGSV